MKFWDQEGISINELAIMVENLIDSLTAAENFNNFQEFIGIPLRIRMMAEMFNSFSIVQSIIENNFVLKTIMFRFC